MKSGQFQKVKFLRRVRVHYVGEIEMPVAVKLVGEQPRPTGKRRGDVG